METMVLTPTIKPIKKVKLKPLPEDSTRLGGSCSITVSVGQKAQEGEILEKTLQLVNKTFSSCDIMLCDTLQRYNYEIMGFSKVEAYQLALKDGERWLLANQKYVSQLTIPHALVRWDEWLRHPDYVESLNQIKRVYTMELKYKDNLDMAANTYITRLLKRNLITVSAMEQYLNVCIEYLQEECAVMLLWASKNYHFEIYPSKRNAAMDITHQYFISPAILKPIALDIRTTKEKTRTHHKSQVEEEQAL